MYYDLKFQAPGPTGEGGTHIQPTIQDVMPRIREVRYDRGQICDDSEREAQRMSDANERWASFTTPTPAFILWDVLEALQLCFLGFYVPSSARDASRVKCSFCKRSFLYGAFRVFLDKYFSFSLQDISSSYVILVMFRKEIPVWRVCK